MNKQTQEISLRNLAGRGITRPTGTIPAENPPDLARTEEAIDFTIANLKAHGCVEKTLQEYRRYLTQLARTLNIFDSKTVINYIVEGTRIRKDLPPIKDSTKIKNTRIYETFCKFNQLPFDRPHFKHKPPIPLIPLTKDVNRVIANCRQNYALMFSIMAETATEAEELHITARTQVSTETGSISIIGTKMHDNGTYKLKPQTAEMLRQYLALHTEEHPFPTPKNLRDAWAYARARAAKTYSKPSIKTIPMKNLRNYAGAVFYNTYGKDPIQTMHFMRHKKLETTLHYLRGVSAFTANIQYISIAIQLNQTDTLDKLCQAANEGYTKFTDAGEYQIFRKVKEST